MLRRSVALSIGFVLSVLVAQPALAQDGRGASCYISDRQDNLYFTNAIPVNAPGVSNKEAWVALSEKIATDFTSYVNEKYGLSLSPEGTVGCNILPSMADAQKNVDLAPDVRSNGLKNFRTGWSTKTASLKAKPGNKANSEGYLTMADKPNPAPARRAAETATKAKAPPSSVGRGSNKSKCHLEGKRYVCPASKQ